MKRNRIVILILVVAILIAGTTGAALADDPAESGPPPTANCVGTLTSASDSNGEEVPAAVQLFNSKGIPFGLWIEYVAEHSGTLQECQQLARAVLFCVAAAPTTDDALACLEN
ncbi:MAG: hypothetical protein R3248_13660 [Candidatus Promineifilaceae bacterium]|nr:hypothetical protein [Candidatus Promineifilaceae bacterium]